MGRTVREVWIMAKAWDICCSLKYPGQLWGHPTLYSVGTRWTVPGRKAARHNVKKECSIACYPTKCLQGIRRDNCTFFMKWYLCNSELQPTRCNFSWFIRFYRRRMCFGRFLRPSSGAHNCTHSFRYSQPILLLAATVDEMELMMGGGTAWNVRRL